MKQALFLLLALLMLAVCCAGLAEDAPDSGMIAGRTWVSVTDARLTLNPDGTGRLVNGELNLEGTWTLDAGKAIFSYELYGKRTLTLYLSRDDEGTEILVNDEGATFYPEEKMAQLKAGAEAQSNAYTVAWGENINVGFTELSLTDFRVMREIRGESGVGFFEPENPDSKYLTAAGTISNKSGAALSRNAIAVSMRVDDRNNYNGKIYMEYNGSLVSDLPAAGSGRLFIYAMVPNEIADNFSKVRIEFGFNNNFSAVPAAPGDGSFCFGLDVDQAMAEQSREIQAREMVYFEESPSLPVPVSYIDVDQSGSSSSKTNGKVTKIEYRYRLHYDSDNGSALFPEYISGLQQDGYKVETSGGNYVISYGGKKLATISFDSKQLKVNIVPGNENLTERPEKKDSTKKETKTEKTGLQDIPEFQEVQLPTVRLGGTISTSYLTMNLKKAGHTKELLSYTTAKKPKHWRYYEPNSAGNELFYVLGTFVNKTGGEVNISNLYTEIDFDGKNVYNGSVTSLYGDGRGFTTSVVSGDTGEVYIYAEVPRNILNTYQKCKVKIGMSSDFPLRTLSNGKLLFDRCEDVYVLDLSDMPGGVNIPDGNPVKITGVKTGKKASIDFTNQSGEVLGYVAFNIRCYDKDGNQLFTDQGGTFDIEQYILNDVMTLECENQIPSGKKFTLDCSGNELLTQAHHAEAALLYFTLAESDQTFQVPENALNWFDSAKKRYTGNTDDFRCIYEDTRMIERTQEVMLGIYCATITPDYARHYGLTDAGILVYDVNPDSICGRAGFRIGDMITECNGISPMDDPYTLYRGKEQLLDGKKLEIVIKRDGKQLVITITPDMI